MIDQEIKDYVQSQLKKMAERFSLSLNEQLDENVITPMKKIVVRFKEMENSSDNSDDKKNSLLSVVDPAINMLPMHLKTTIGFVFSFISMAEGKKDAPEIASRVLEEYGTVMGKVLMDAMDEAVSDSKKVKIKTIIKDVKKAMSGSP